MKNLHLNDISLCVVKCLLRAKEGDGERKWGEVRTRGRLGEKDRERERSTQVGGGSIKGPSNRGRVRLMLKLDELLWPLMTFEVILIKMKYLRIYYISIRINFYQNRFINGCVRKNFLKISEGKTEFFCEL